MTYGRTGRRDGRRFAGSSILLPYHIAGCFGWWHVRTSATVTVTSDSPPHVTTWADAQLAMSYTTGKTGAYNLTQATDATRPFFRVRNGRNEVYSPNTAIYSLSCVSAELGALVSGNDVPWSGMIVATKIADNSMELFSLETGTHYNVFGFYASGNQYSSERRAGGTGVAVRGGVPGTTPHVIIYTQTGTKSSLWSNGQAIWTAQAQDVTAMTVGSLVAYFRNAGVHEMAAWNRELSSAEVSTLTLAERRQWSI